MNFLNEKESPILGKENNLTRYSSKEYFRYSGVVLKPNGVR